VQSINSYPSPEDITRTELPNGITVLMRSNFHTPSLIMRGYLHAGALFDSDEKLGTADFTALALMRGTRSRDYQTIFDQLETVGAGLGVGAATHTVGFSGRALVEDLDLLLDILSEVLRYPTFPPNEIERLRTQLLTGLDLRAQSTSASAGILFDQIVYPNHPYGRPEDGFPETVQVIQRQDLIDFHTTYYGPHQMVITIVGAVEPENVIDKLNSAIGDWHNPNQPTEYTLPLLSPPAEPRSRRIDIPGKKQSDLLVGAAGPPRHAPEYLASALGNNILGKFGLMGRIGDVVREQAGLAYYASSSILGGQGPAPWYVYAGVDPINEEEVIAMIRSELLRFTTELVTEEELSDSKSNWIGRMPISLESNAGVAAMLLKMERHQLGLDYLQRYPALVKSITREQVCAAATKYLHPDHLAVAIAGPSKENIQENRDE
jgi:zinc protease